MPSGKQVRVDGAGGSNFKTLPGSSGEWNEEAGSVEDTIFGQTFQSQEIALLSWTLSAQAFYKGFAGYVAKLKKQASSATSVTGEAMSNTTGQIYKIDDTTKEIFDRSQSITVYDDGSDETANVEWIDYLFGRVKFDDGYTVNGPVTIDVSYFSTSSLGTANSFTLTQTADTINTSDFDTVQGNGGFMTYDPGLRTVNMELSGPFASSQDFQNTLKNRNELILEIDPSGNGAQDSQFRGYFKASSRGQSGDVGALEEETVNFLLNVPQTDNLWMPASWEHGTNSSLSQAVVDILDNWLNETKPKVRYFYDQTNYYEGTGVVTDVSLTGGLESMNEFTANFQGDGEYTTGTV
jgi:hypothetical protein